MGTTISMHSPRESFTVLAKYSQRENCFFFAAMIHFLSNGAFNILVLCVSENIH